jgi:hypothetical protein
MFTIPTDRRRVTVFERKCRSCGQLYEVRIRHQRGSGWLVGWRKLILVRDRKEIVRPAFA